MLVEVAHQPCPYVSCGSSDAFSYNTGGYGRCHACERGYPSKERTFEWAKRAAGALVLLALAIYAAHLNGWITLPSAGKFEF